MTVTPEEVTAKRWKYAAYIAGIGAAFVAAGLLGPANWMTLVLGLFA